MARPCRALAAALAVTALSTAPVLAQSHGTTISVYADPSERKCEAQSTDVPVGAATDCATAMTAARDALLLSVERGCETLCEGELKAQMFPPTCIQVSEKEWSVGLKWQCGDETGTGTGIIKLCKVAGPGVTVGAPFTFNVGGNLVTVPAGPPPAGTCVVGPSFAVGTTVSTFETIPPGHTVSSIDVAPPGRVVGTPNLPGGSVDVTIGAGVTEVTFTDERTGFIEICKKGDVTGSFSFTVNPGGKGPFVVPAGACSPAIEVVAGPVIISELPTADSVMVGCSTIPAANQLACDPQKWTSTVNVVGGDISTQTIAYIENRRTGPGETEGTGTGPGHD